MECSKSESKLFRTRIAEWQEAYMERLPSNIIRTGFSLERAQMILSDFANICGSGRWYGDLALYFAECATDFTMNYGDINEKFYDALGDAYQENIIQFRGLRRIRG